MWNREWNFPVKHIPCVPRILTSRNSWTRAQQQHIKWERKSSTQPPWKRKEKKKKTTSAHELTQHVWSGTYFLKNFFSLPWCLAFSEASFWCNMCNNSRTVSRNKPLIHYKHPLKLHLTHSKVFFWLASMYKKE